jgi:hypothetical protein
MPEKKKDDGFTVTDRRLFTADGELRQEAAEEEARSSPPANTAPAAVQDTPKTGEEAANKPDPIPQPPSAEEQEASSDAYRTSNREIDARLASQPGAPRPQDLEMTFEKLLTSIYMTAFMQLGLMHPEGREPQIDLLGARQSIDTLSLLAEKTKGNLTSAESNLLQNALYEARMAYLEVTNALTRPPAPGTEHGPRAK